MRVLIERVLSARVEIDGANFSEIGKGLLVYVGVSEDDEIKDVEYISDKISYLRIFEDDNGKMNLDIFQVGGEILAISAFTLQANARKGRRPSFDKAARPEKANRLYELLIDKLKSKGLAVKTGKFANHMNVQACNDGPICILLDSAES